MLEEEKQYIVQAQQGDKAAFSALYGQHLSRIYRFIFLKVSDKEEAEDLTHEVFLSAWQNIGAYRYQGLPFSSWLYRIARNAVIDFYRSSANKKTVQIEMASENLIKLPAQDPDMLDTRMEIEKTKKAIALLKPEYQDVIIMRFIENLSYEEVAAALGKSEGALRIMQHRALKELKLICHNGTTLKTITGKA